MPDTKARVYLHLVWTTWRRQPWLSEDLERAVHRCIAAQVVGLGCKVLALGGTTDHVHLIVRLSTRVTIAQLAQRAKGVSSTLVRQSLRVGQPFGWQDGYGAFSLSATHLKDAIGYVRNQKRHHGTGDLWQVWEAREDSRHPPGGGNETRSAAHAHETPGVE